MGSRLGSEICLSTQRRWDMEMTSHQLLYDSSGKGNVRWERGGVGEVRTHSLKATSIGGWWIRRLRDRKDRKVNILGERECQIKVILLMH